MISPENVELYRKIYAREKTYGRGGKPRAMNYIIDKLNELRRTVKTVLDFGCGAGVLCEILRDKGFVVMGYDPAIAGKDKLPDKVFDAIVSRDVLEHIEPEHINEVVQWIGDHTTKVQVHKIALVPAPAKHNLDNGRNAHYIVKPPHYWLDKLAKYGYRGEWEVDPLGKHLSVTIWK